MITVLNRQRRHRIRAAKFKRLLERLVRRYRPGKAEICLTFIGTDRMRTLNRRFRKKDGTTDVLSFPLPDPPGGVGRHLGDIVIAPEAARRQARELGHGLERELEVLTVHGFLHLLGYDHSPRMDREESRALGRERRPPRR